MRLSIARFFFAWTFVLLMVAMIVNAWREHGPVTSVYLILGVVFGCGLSLCARSGALDGRAA